MALDAAASASFIACTPHARVYLQLSASGLARKNTKLVAATRAWGVIQYSFLDDSKPMIPGGMGGFSDLLEGKESKAPQKVIRFV